MWRMLSQLCLPLRLVLVAPARMISSTDRLPRRGISTKSKSGQVRLRWVPSEETCFWEVWSMKSMCLQMSPKTISSLGSWGSVSCWPLWDLRTQTTVAKQLEANFGLVRVDVNLVIQFAIEYAIAEDATLKHMTLNPNPFHKFYWKGELGMRAKKLVIRKLRFPMKL